MDAAGGAGMPRSLLELLDALAKRGAK